MTTHLLFALLALAAWHRAVPANPPETPAPARRSLRVHVVDEAGAPAEGAMVWLLPEMSDHFSLVSPEARDRPRDPGCPEIWTVSDSSGLASFEGLPAEVLAIRVSEHPSGYVNGIPAATSTCDLSQSSEPAEITICLGAIEQMTVRGRVLDEMSGDPIASAQICWGSWGQGGGWRTTVPSPVSPDGGFAVVAGAYPFEMRLLATAPGHERVDHRVSPDRSSDETIRLARTFQVQGRIFEGGQPARRAMLLLFRWRDNAWTVLCASDEAVLGDGGRFRWSVPRAATPPCLLLAVSAERGAVGRVTLPADFAPGAPADVGDLALAPLRSLTGRVTDPSGAPIAGARVAWESAYAAPQASPRFGWLVETDREGAFTLTDVPDGSWSVAAAAGGFLEHRERVEVSGDATHELTLSPVRGRELLIRVIGEDARPLTGTIVQVWDARGGQFRNRYQPLWEDGGHTDASGELRIAHVPVDACHCELMGRHVPVGVSTYFDSDVRDTPRLRRVVQMSQSSQEMVIDMSRWPRLSAHITRGGLPVADARVAVYDNLQGDTWNSADTDAGGRCAVAVPPGTYSLIVSLGRVSLWEASGVDVTANRELDLDLDALPRQVDQHATVVPEN